MTTQKLSCAALLAGIAIALCGCTHGNASLATATAIPVQTATVVQAELDTATHYSATIEPDSTVDMAFKVDGYVESLMNVGGRNLQVGDLVAKGAVLARVRQSDYQAGLDASRGAGTAGG